MVRRAALAALDADRRRVGRGRVRRRRPRLDRRDRRGSARRGGRRGPCRGRASRERALALRARARRRRGGRRRAARVDHGVAARLATVRASERSTWRCRSSPRSSSPSRSSAARRTRSSSRAERDRRCCSCSCPASSRSARRSRSRGSSPCSRDFVPIAARDGSRHGWPPSGSREGRAQPWRPLHSSTIAFAVALLAEGYRATLTSGDREQAAFAVPHDVVVRENLQNLVRVFDAASIERFEALAGEGGAARPVLRVTAGVGRAERVSGVTVLGLDGAAIEELGIWRDEWADGRGRSELAALVETGRPCRDARTRSPGRPDRVRGRARSRLARGGGPHSRWLVQERSSWARRRHARRPPCRRAAPAGSLLISLEIVPPPRLIEGGADAGQAFIADVSLAGPQARRLRDWMSVGGSRRSAHTDGRRHPRPADAAAQLGVARCAADRHIAAGRPRDAAPRRARGRSRARSSRCGSEAGRCRCVSWERSTAFRERRTMP